MPDESQTPMDRNEARRLGRLMLGDRIESGLKAIGVHQAVKAIERRTGWDCGCSRRKSMLNRMALPTKLGREQVVRDG